MLKSEYGEAKTSLRSVARENAYQGRLIQSNTHGIALRGA